MGFCHHGTSRRQSPTSAHGRCSSGNGEERGRTLRAHNPATLPLQSPQQAACRSPRLSQGPMATSPPRKSHSESFVGQTQGPAFGTAPARGPWGFRHHGTSRRQSPTSAHARCRAGNGEERGRTQHARNPATLPLKSPQQAAWRSPHLSQGPMAASPPRKSHSDSFVGQTQGPALGTAPARCPWGFRHHGTSRRQSPTSMHARCRAGNGEERGRTQRSQPRHAPALEPPASRMAFAPVRGPWSCHRLENPTAKALFARPGAQPSARHPRTAGGGSFITGPRGTSRPPTRMHAVGLGTGKSGGGPSALATPIRSRSKAPSKPHGVRPGQGPMVLSPPRKSHSESFVCKTRSPALGTAVHRRWGFRHHGTSRRQPPTSAHTRCRARNGEERGRTQALATPPFSRSRAPPRRPPVARGVLSSRDLEAPVAHQRTRTL